MSDVKMERKESVSREDAAAWLQLLSRAFAEGSDVELEFKWSTARSGADTQEKRKNPPKDRPRRPNSARRSAKTP